MSLEAFDDIFEQLKSNTRLAIQGLIQASADGSVTLSLPDFAMVMVASCFGVALRLGCTVDQLRTVAARCLHDAEPPAEDPAKKIILS